MKKLRRLDDLEEDVGIVDLIPTSTTAHNVPPLEPTSSGLTLATTATTMPTEADCSEECTPTDLALDSTTST